MLERLLNALHQRRGVTLVCALALALLGAWGASNLSINDAPERWMPASSVADWERFAEHFEYGDTIVIGVEFHQGVRDEDLGFLTRLRLDLGRIPGVLRVTDVSLVAEQLEGVPLTELLRTTPRDAVDPYDLYRGVLFDDPRSWNGDGGNPGRTLLTVVEINASPDLALPAELRQEGIDARRRQAMEQMYEVLERYQRPGVTYHAAGAVVIQYALEQIARTLMVTLLPPSILLILFALGFVFRSLTAVWIAALGGAWGICVMLGCVWLAGWSMNVVTVGGPTLMTVIVVATTVHLAHYESETKNFDEHGPGPGSPAGRTAPATRHEASAAARRHFVHWVALPCLGASLTTGFGFLMLAFNELGPARELGFELFGGSTLAFFGVYLAWLLLAPFKAAPGRWLSPPRLRTAVQSISSRPAVTAGIIVGLLALAGWTSSWMQVDADPFSFFEKESREARALSHFSERKFGMYLLDVILVPQDQPADAAARKAVRERDHELARRFEAEVMQRPEVRHVISTASMQQRMLALAEANREAWSQLSRAHLLGWGARIVTAPTLARRAELLRESWSSVTSNAVDGLEYYLRYAAFRSAFKNWTVDRSGRGAIRITFLVYDPGTGFRPLLNSVRDELATLPAGRFDYFITGTAANVAILSEQLMGSTTIGLIAATAAMVTLCLYLFRSVRLTLIAILPNALPNMFVFGLMGLFGIPLNSGSAMVTTIALGVALNDTVHFIMHYRHRRSEGEPVDEALYVTFAEIGRPIVLTSVVMCLGFAIFLLSDFLPMYHFGLLGSISMVAALSGDMVLLPCLLRLFDRDPRTRRKAAAEPAQPAAVGARGQS